MKNLGALKGRVDCCDEILRFAQSLPRTRSGDDSYFLGRRPGNLTNVSNEHRHHHS